MNATSNLSRNASLILKVFAAYQSDNECSLYTMRLKLDYIGVSDFDATLTELRKANVLSLSSADRFVSQAELAGGIREHGETLTHCHRCQ
jgi:hypothetical protein